MNNPFVHLHVHSEYSLLDGAARTSELAKATAEFGMNAVALTDHGVMYGCVDFYKDCLKAEVKPILGCEVYVAPSGYTCKEAKEQYHLILLAENQEGYANLARLVSIGCTDGFYYKPRIDHDLLAKYGNGLIACSACLGGEIPSLLLAGDEEGASARANMYRDILGRDNFFLEIQPNQMPEQAIVNKALIRMSREAGFGLVATNDSHYMKKSDAEWHDMLLCVQTGSKINDERRFRFSGDDYYFRTPEEMWQIFGAEVPESLLNTVKIGERCNVELEFGTYHLPDFEVPEGSTLTSHLRRMAADGLRERLGGRTPDNYGTRLEYELGVIEEMGFEGYFCIVSDIIQYAKQNKIPVGPGRGSAAGSLVAWSLKITDVDPIAHGLIFERFLNIERISMPDIDTDISDKQRDQVITYIVEKYGSDHVSQIITFGRMMSKAAVKDVGRAMDIPYADVDRVAKLIPDALKTGIKTIPEAIGKIPDLKKAYEGDPVTRKLLDVASKIEGLARHCSQHAAGVVITPKPTMDMVPVTRIKGSQIVTQYSMKPVDDLGLVKMDFLGLRTLSIIEGALQNIVSSGYEPLDLDKIPMDDGLTFDMLRRGDTMGVFQIESDGQKELIRRLKPDRFEDLVALMALYRPGPLENGMDKTYVRRKHGEEAVDYPHPLLEEALSETYGVILYQEQVMQAAVQLAGFSMGEADILRSAMGKKKVDVMEEQRVKFVGGAKENGVDEDRAAQIFDIIEKFAGYGFNKSHSVAYALITYRTAYLKAHYSPEFLASFLSAQIGSKQDVMGSYIRQVRTLGFDVLAPDINRSGANFTVSGKDILFGLSAVAKAGSTAVESILRAREEGGPFNSLWDFVMRVDKRTVNQGVVNNLIKSGAFDGIDSNRRKLIDSVQGMMAIASKQVSDKKQMKLFDDDNGLTGPEGFEIPDVPNFDQHELLRQEKEAVGIYISGHPYDKYVIDEYKYANCSVTDLEHWQSPNEPAVVLGLLVEFREVFTKGRGDKPRPMGILIVEDSESQVEVVCYTRKWPDVKPLLQVGSPYLITGNVQREAKVSLILERFEALSEAKGARRDAVRIRIVDEHPTPELYGMIREELRKYPGDQTVMLDLWLPDSKALMQIRTMKVSLAPGLAESISSLSQGRASVVSYIER